MTPSQGRFGIPVRYRLCTCDDTVSGTVRYSSGLMYLHFHTTLLKQVLTWTKRIRTGQKDSGTGLLLFGMLKRLILVNNQLDALFFNVSIYFPSLHVSSNPVFIIRKIKLYQYIIWYISLCIGDCLVCQSGRTWPAYLPVTYTEWYTRWCIDTIRFSWSWAQGCSKHIKKWNK